MLSIGGGNDEYYMDDVTFFKRGGLEKMDEDEEEEIDKMYEPLEKGDQEEDRRMGERFGVANQQDMHDDDPMEDDNGENRPMDEEESSDEVFRLDEAQIPDPTPCVVYNESRTFVHFDVNTIPDSIPMIPPQILKGLTSPVMDTVVKIKGLTCMHRCLPMMVHSSPVVSLFMTRTKSKKESTIPSKPLCIGWMDTCFQLHQLKAACNAGLIQFHPSVAKNPSMLTDAEQDYQNQVKLLGLNQDSFMDALYKAVLNGEIKGHAAMTEFASSMEKYAMRYVHLIERFLYTCLIEPHGSGLRLEHVLTPYTPSLELKDANDPVRVRQMVVDFFKFKVELERAQVKSYGNNETQFFERAFNLQQLPYRIQVHPTTKKIKYNCQQNQVWKGYISMQTLFEYFWFCDTDEMLRNAGWEWHP